MESEEFYTLNYGNNMKKLGIFTIVFGMLVMTAHITVGAVLFIAGVIVMSITLVLKNENIKYTAKIKDGQLTEKFESKISVEPVHIKKKKSHVITVNKPKQIKRAPNTDNGQDIGFALTFVFCLIMFIGGVIAFSVLRTNSDPEHKHYDDMSLDEKVDGYLRQDEILKELKE